MAIRRALIPVTIALAGIIACTSGGQTPPEQPPARQSAPAPEKQPAAKISKGAPRTLAQPEMTIDQAKSYTATIETSKGTMTVNLFADEAPITVNNFVYLAGEHFYDGVVFHRIIKDFMVQTGDPTGTGSGGPGYRFDDEPVTRDYERGILAMANSGPNTNGSQFFIIHQDYSLPKNYTIFGQVVEGLDALDAIAETPVSPGARGEQSVPAEEIKILSISVEAN